MPLVVKDRVVETTSSTGTGTITLGGAVAGYQSFSVIGNGNTTYYTISGGSEWEVGIGTYTSSGTTLSRDTVLESSNGGSLVNFSAGTKNVFVTYPAEKAVYKDANNVFSEFASGTAMLFVQSSAPTGWTKSTTHNDKALRVVSGAASSGGSVAFSTAFASQTPSGTVSVSVSAGTLSVSAGTLATGNTTATGSVSISGGAVGSTTLTSSQIPAHTHNLAFNRAASTDASGMYFAGQSGVTSIRTSSTTDRNATDSVQANTGGGGSHTHGFTNPTGSFTGDAHNHTITGSPSLSGSPSVTSSTFTGNAINLGVQYVDVIIATKD
jgi:hypothetical protein